MRDEPHSSPPGHVLYRRRGLRLSARLRLALSYVVFLVVAGAATLFGVYLVLRYVPDYPLTASNPRDSQTPVPSRQEILEALVSSSGYLLLTLGAVGGIGGWFLAGWILKPLHLINDAARVAASGDLTHPIHLTGRNDEFRELADSFDHMLDRLREAFEHRERFAANASHELRTPLSVTSMLLDVAASDPGSRRDDELLTRLKITNDRAIGLTEALLKLADVNAAPVASDPLDLAEIAGRVLDEQRGEAERHGVVLLPELRAAPTRGDATLLAQLTANLVQNAIRHNEHQGTVWITTDHDHTGAVLRVENGGAVYTPQSAERLTEPFLRGDGRVTVRGRERGYGLGLALVSRIAEVHRGTLRIAPRAGGGLIVEVDLPPEIHP
ncbi:HAMP domain-containing sensor histidine kinase [Okibacterium endophyticum]